MSKKTIMLIIVIVAVILYICGLIIIGSASLRAKDGVPEVNKSWVDIVAAVTTVLGMNAGAYLGLPDTRRRLVVGLDDPNTIRGWATIVYFIAIVAAFVISVSSTYPHPSLTDMAGSLLGFIVGTLSVYLGRD